MAVSMSLRSQRWRRLIKSYLLTTGGIGVSSTLGDFICQFLERRKTIAQNEYEPFPSLPWWNYRRSAIMCTTAVCVTTPYSFTLARTVEWAFPGTQWIQIAKKLATTTLMAPVIISLVFTSITLLKGRSLVQAKEKVSTDMPRAYLTGSFYWPFVSILNFRFIPLDYRPFMMALAGVLWNIYMSNVANKEPV